MPNRTRNEIIVKMLQSLMAPALKTNVMYEARLSYDQLNRYGDLLLRKGLAIQLDGKWVITERGRALVKACAKAEEIIR